MRYSEISDESKLIEAKETWYHGSNTVITEFSLDHLSTGQGADQEGPGIYLTSNALDARKYGKHIHIITAMIAKTKLMSDTKKTHEFMVNRLISKSPERDVVLSNWDENPNKAKQLAVQSIMTSYGDNCREACEQIWYDFYRDHPSAYLKQIVQMTGCIGFKLTRSHDINHLICWDPSILKITELVT